MVMPEMIRPAYQKQFGRLMVMEESSTRPERLPEVTSEAERSGAARPARAQPIAGPVAAVGCDFDFEHGIAEMRR